MPNDFESILKELGYDLYDRGDSWQTSAVFRGGNNKTAISIFKDSGVWHDFVEGRSYPFEALYEKTTGRKFNGEISKLTVETRKKHIFLKEEKTYPESCLKKLLPDYTYFESRDISAETQRQYKCGLATGGKLYQRIVFPIFREDGKIHGFHGRKVLQDNDRPKWLPSGKHTDWFYPFYSVDGVEEKIREEGRLFLVESIGDSMSLYQAGVENNISSITNKVGPKLLSRLANLNCQIVVSFNNDEGQNRGFDGALASILKMIDVIDFNQIYFFPPPKGDFGDMTDLEIEKWKKGLDFSEEGHKLSMKRLIDYAPEARIAKSELAKLNKLKKKWGFCYE